MKPSGPNIKSVLIFSQKRFFLYFEKRNFLVLKFQDGTFRDRKINKTHSEKIPCISGNKTF